MSVPVSIWATLPGGVEVADMTGDEWHIVNINGHPTLVADRSGGAEIRLPLTVTEATALIVAAAGGAR